MFKKIFFVFLCIAVGAVFILSALSKLYPIEPFEYSFVEMGISNWRIAPFIARFIIGLEFFIGTIFVFNFKIKTACKISAATLILFSGYLLGLMIMGNKGNCGCFGQYFPMTPLQALIKNGVMLLLTGIIYKNNYNQIQPSSLSYCKRIIILGLLVVISFILPHILNYVNLNYSEAYLSDKEDQYKIELDTLYNNAKVNMPPKSLSEGKHIIAFMSLTCPHCRIAAKKMSIIKKLNPDISFYFVLNGESEMISPFFEDTRATNIPYCMLSGNSFIFLAGTVIPAIYLINNKMVESRLNYFSLDQEKIEMWMASTVESEI